MNTHLYNTVELQNITTGVPFMMVNYDGVFIRVEADPKYGLVRDTAIGSGVHTFNDDGAYMSIVELMTGKLFLMAKTKLCLVYPGSDIKRDSSRRE